MAAALRRRAPRVPGLGQHELQDLIQRLDRYAEGEGRLLFEPSSRRTEPGSLSFHCLARLPETDRPLAALLSLDRLLRLRPSRHALISLHDHGRLIGSPLAGSYLVRHMTAAPRTFGITLASGEVAGRAADQLPQLLAAAGMTVLLRQSPEALGQLADVMHLTPAEQSWLRRAAPDEGLLIAQGRRLAFQAVASDEEERLTRGGTP
jgi:hypothetical protein